MNGITLTSEAKTAMIANLQLELEARKEKLRAMCEAQCASLRSRLERRVNRVPATKRDMPLVELLAPKPTVTKAETTTVKSVKEAPTKVTKAPVTRKPAPAPAPATRRTRAPATTTSKAVAPAAQVLSPKNANSRQKPAKSNARPR
ncbi:hypothetical protein GQ44DRAFT_17825 [Phaeosphaeriaceae sp. PMI808]|nr:hypothetical protein GQ44DRAFT_17825 [Phaeosphaeriaceae sp. PMI808]